MKEEYVQVDPLIQCQMSYLIFCFEHARSAQGEELQCIYVASFPLGKSDNVILDTDGCFEVWTHR